MSRQTRRSWPADRLIKAKALWTQGWSAAKIARELGDVTRNAVIGQMRRMGLSNDSREPDAPRPLRTAKAPPAPPRRYRPHQPLPAATGAPAAPLNIPMLDIGYGQCRWPLWAHGSGWPDFLMCGLPCWTDAAYCAAHARIAASKTVKATEAEEVAA